MIEICETWQELIDWCWDSGKVFVTVEWGQPRTIQIDLSDTNCDLPFKKVEFDEFYVYFDGVRTCSLSPRNAHMMIQALISIRKD